MGNVPVRCWKRRSFKQCASLEHKMMVRTFWPTGLICHVMPNVSATGRSAAVNSSFEDALVASTRMKKLPVLGLPYCWESAILQPASRRAPATAWTMPGRSGQESVTTKAAGKADSVTRISLPVQPCCTVNGSQLALGGLPPGSGNHEDHGSYAWAEGHVLPSHARDRCLLSSRGRGNAAAGSLTCSTTR